MRSLSVKQLGKQSLILIRWQSKEENLYAEIRGEVLPSKVTARHSCAPNLDIATTSRPTKQFWKPQCNYETETKEKSASSSAWPVQQLTLLYIKTYTKTQQHCWPEDLNMQQIDTGRIPSPIHVVDFHFPHPQNTSSFLLIKSSASSPSAKTRAILYTYTEKHKKNSTTIEPNPQSRIWRHLSLQTGLCSPTAR